MFCEVITLRKDGMRLRPEEWPEPERGRLVMGHMPATICADRRTVREVSLMGRWVSTARCILRLFDADFVDVVGDGFLLRGHILNVVEKRVFVHEQIWLVRPCQTEDGPPLPRFDVRPFLKKLPIEDRADNEPSVSERWREAHPD